MTFNFPSATFWAQDPPPHLDVCYLTLNFWCGRGWEVGVGNVTAHAGKGYTIPNAEPTKPQATLRIGLHWKVVLISAQGRLSLKFLLSNTRWSNWPNAATKLVGGAIAPGPTLNVAITLSLAERLVGPGRACAEPPFCSSRPPRPSPALSVSSALGAGKALGPRARDAPRTRAEHPTSHESFEALTLPAPTLVLTPSHVPGIPAP